MKEFESFIFILFGELFLTLFAIHSSKGKSITASIFAALNTMLYCLNIENIIVNKWCIASAMLGALIGTFMVVKFVK